MSDQNSYPSYFLFPYCCIPFKIQFLFFTSPQISPETWQVHHCRWELHNFTAWGYFQEGSTCFVCDQLGGLFCRQAIISFHLNNKSDGRFLADEAWIQTVSLPWDPSFIVTFILSVKEGLCAYCDQVCWAFCFRSPYYPAHVQLALLNKLGSRKHHLLMISILFQSKSVLNHPSSLLLSTKSQQTGKQTLGDSLPGNKNLLLQSWKICLSVWTRALQNYFEVIWR